MAGGVFISYRREDSAGFARAIYVRLSEHLGRDKVFFDVNDIVSGDDFVEVLSKRVGDCDALVAIIGKDWLNSVDKSGRRRLDNVEDFVRVEIAAALSRGVRVIPVLVEDAAMPQAPDLPENLKMLARRQALEVDNKRFDFDVDQLAKVLSPPKELETGARWRPVAPRDGAGRASPGPSTGATEPARRDPPTPAPASLKPAPLAFVMVGVAVLAGFGWWAMKGGGLKTPSAPVAPVSDRKPAPPAPTPPDPAANAAAGPLIKDSSVLLGPSGKLIDGPANAAAKASPKGDASAEDLAQSVDQQKGALARAAQDVDRLTRDADAAAQGIQKNGDDPGNTANVATLAASASGRYRTTDCGSITDGKTGMEWLVGPDKDFGWQDANAWIRGLTACGKSWRLPSAAEVSALIDKSTTAGTGFLQNGKHFPAHLNAIFSGIGRGSWVWTNGSASGGTAPTFNLNQGLPTPVAVTNSGFTVRAFAVAKGRP